MGYFLTGIGALLKIICDMIVGSVSGDGAALASGLFTFIGFLLSGIGIIKTLIHGEGAKGKLIGLAIHAAIWVVVFLGLSILLPIIILAVALFVFDHFFLGGGIFRFLHDRLAGGVTPDGEGDWPFCLYDIAGNVYELDINMAFKESAVYKGSSGEITVHLSDINAETKTVYTIYGELHW